MILKETFKIILIILYTSKFNIFLLFVPIGFIAHFLNWNDIVIFFFNFVAIILLANLLGFATEELSHGIGQVFENLLTFLFN